MDSKELKAIVNGYSRHLEVYDETRAASNTLSSRFAVLKAELERVDSNEREAKRLTDENKRLRDKLRAAETEAESKKKAVSAFEKQIEELQRRLQTQLPQLSHAPPYQGPSAPVYQPVDDDDELPDLDL
jgi:predicted  nucleic acid-binding Zn-ribbon protein